MQEQEEELLSFKNDLNDTSKNEKAKQEDIEQYEAWKKAQEVKNKAENVADSNIKDEEDKDNTEEKE